MGIKVIKAIKVKEQKDIDLYKNYEDIADLILFDYYIYGKITKHSKRFN